MRSQILAGLAFGIVAVVSGTPIKSRASDEQVTIDNTVFVREDANQNDNWDAVISAGLSLVTSSGTIRCDTNSLPLPSTVYACADPAYSFQISGRPGYNLYTITVSHKVSDSVTLTGQANVGCNGPIPMSCAQVGSRDAILIAA